MTESTEKKPKYNSVGLAITANDVEGAKEIVTLLKEQNKYLSNEDWTTLLFKTLDNMTPETAQYLKDQGADVNAYLELPSKTRSARSEAFSLGYSTMAADNKELLAWMVDQKWVDENQVTPGGDTLLVQAIRECAFDVAQMLVDKGMSIDHQNLRGVSALHEAASIGNYEALNWLMERNANPMTETMGGAIACELVPDPEDADNPQEAEMLFAALDSYYVDYKNNNTLSIAPFIVQKAEAAKKLRCPDQNLEPPKQKRLSM